MSTASSRNSEVEVLFQWARWLDAQQHIDYSEKRSIQKCRSSAFFCTFTETDEAKYEVSITNAHEQLNTLSCFHVVSGNIDPRLNVHKSRTNEAKYEVPITNAQEQLNTLSRFHVVSENIELPLLVQSMRTPSVNADGIKAGWAAFLIAVWQPLKVRSP